MKLLLVTSVDPWVRSVASVHRLVAAGRVLRHEIFVYGEPNAQLPNLPFTTDLAGVDCAVFIMQVAWDLPDMPNLARLLDGIPRDRRIAMQFRTRSCSPPSLRFARRSVHSCSTATIKLR